MNPLFSSNRFLQTQPDVRLVALARAGHERAFEALIKRYRAPLLAYCRRITPSHASAEDALQEALLQAWVALRADAEVRDTRAWLYSIVHNITVSNLRSSGPPSAALTEVDASRGADEEAEQRMEARDALAGIAALPELQRDVMVRTVVDGLSHEELASELGLSRGAVRGLIYRARARLRAAAAVCIPGLVIEWAARRGHGGSSPAAGIHEVIAGGGSAGVGGFLLKSSAVVATAGAVATAVGITGDRVHPRNDGAGAGASAGTRLDKPTVRSARNRRP